MKKFFEKNKFNIVRVSLLIPIILVSIISISHVTEWYDIANPAKWALYLSISVEVAAMVSILGFSLRMKGGAWAIFLIVTLIQMIGNIFFSYSEIDENSELFKSWVELTAPVWDSIGSDSTDVISMKRWLSFLEGGLLPIISLTSLHFFVKFNEGKPKEITEETVDVVLDEPIGDEETENMMNAESVNNPIYEITKIIQDNTNNTDESQSKKVWDKVRELREEGKLSIPTQEDIENEPTELAFTPYDIEDEIVDNKYLDLQESRLPVNEGINEGVNEGINEGVNDGVNDGVEPIIETTETINDNIRDIINEIGDDTVNDAVNEGLMWEDKNDNIKRIVYSKSN